jgi:hypothetical protein
VPLRAAYERARRRFGETDHDILAAAGALVIVLRDQGEPQKRLEAKSLGEKTLRARKERLGPDHVDTLQSMHDLATVLSVNGSVA